MVLLDNKNMNKKILILFSFLMINLNNFAYANETNTMDEYWQTRWKIKDIGWDQQQPNPLLVEYFNLFKLKSGSRIFVPLSGKSVDMVWLAKQGYHVIGVELSLEACQLFFTEHHIPYKQSKQGNFDILTSEKITLLSGDFFDLDKTILGNVDAVYDRAALIALPTETRRQYAKKTISLLDSHAQILLITFNYSETEMQGPPFSVNKKETQQLFGKNFNVTQLHDEPVSSIPKHLRDKGLTELRELAFHLTPT